MSQQSKQIQQTTQDLETLIDKYKVLKDAFKIFTQVFFDIEYHLINPDEQLLFKVTQNPSTLQMLEEDIKYDLTQIMDNYKNFLLRIKRYYFGKDSKLTFIPFIESYILDEFNFETHEYDDTPESSEIQIIGVYDYETFQPISYDYDPELKTITTSTNKKARILYVIKPDKSNKSNDSTASNPETEERI